MRNENLNFAHILPFLVTAVRWWFSYYLNHTNFSRFCFPLSISTFTFTFLFPHIFWVRFQRKHFQNFHFCGLIFDKLFQFLFSHSIFALLSDKFSTSLCFLKQKIFDYFSENKFINSAKFLSKNGRRKLSLNVSPLHEVADFQHFWLQI